MHSTGFNILIVLENSAENQSNGVHSLEKLCVTRGFIDLLCVIEGN